jgi:hypothetical protein
MNLNHAHHSTLFLLAVALCVLSVTDGFISDTRTQDQSTHDGFLEVANQIDPFIITLMERKNNFEEASSGLLEIT